MKIIRVDKDNQVNGAGLRCVIWVAGCENKCPGCHNPETWDYNAGHDLTIEEYRTINQQLLSPEISGVTLTGGDPMAPRNRAATAKLCYLLKRDYPTKTIWVYSGHSYETLVDYLADVDVLIDGKYVAALNPGIGKLKWRGSFNQRVIDVQKSLKAGRVVEYIDFNGHTIAENEHNQGLY